MKLAYQLDDVAALPEQLQQAYTKTDDGKYKLNVEGIPEGDKVKEFRDKNIELMKQVAQFDTLKTVIGADGLDPDKLHAKLDALAATKAADALKNKDQELATVKTTASQLQGLVEDLLISDQVTKLALKHGVLESAVPDVLARAKTAFQVEGREVKVRDGKLGEDGKPLTMEVWFSKLSETATHFFGASQGAGVKKPGSSKEQPTMTPVERISAGLSKLRSK